MLSLYLAIVVLIALQRLSELRRSKRNVAALLARGGQEIRGSHFAVMRLMHLSWLVSCTAFAVTSSPPQLAMVLCGAALLVIGQLLRLTAITTLGERWTVSVVALAGEPRIRRGIYRYVNHPNYLGVSCEIAGLPLLYGLWSVGAVFSLINGVLLAYRIRIESRALQLAEGISL